MKSIVTSGILFIIVVGSIFLFHQSISHAEHVLPEEVVGWADHVVLSQIKESGGTGKTTEEFIELYNPTDEVVFLSGWQIGKYTKAGGARQTIMVFGEQMEIAPFGYLLVAYSTTTVPTADATYELAGFGNTLSPDNSVVLLDASQVVVDLVGYGSASVVEGDGPAPTPLAGKSIQRLLGGVYGNGVDRDQNSSDWKPSDGVARSSASEAKYQPIATHAPVASFVISDGDEDNEFFIGQDILFDASLSNDQLDGGEIAQYQWNFGDGTTSTIGVATTSHQYEAVGEYTISLLVVDMLGETGEVQKEILIVDPADFPEDGEEEPIVEEEVVHSVQTTLVINEFVSEPASGEKEWVEIYSAATSAVDLTGFTLWDGAGKIANLAGNIGPGAFVVIELPTSKLNNTGDRIILKNSADEVVDQVTFGGWDDDTVGDNAKRPTSPNSIARVVDGQDTDIDTNDFVETTTPTKGASNTITAPISPPASTGGGGGGGSGGTQTPTIGSGTGVILINELVTDPTEDQDEFVELYNKGNEPVDLTGWWIEDGSKAKTLLSGMLLPGAFVVIDNPKGKLNNAGDIVTIFSSDGKTIDWVAYGNWVGGEFPVAPKKGKSLSRKKDGVSTGKPVVDFIETSTITKAGANIVTDVDTNIDMKPSSSSSTQQFSSSSGSIIITELLPNPTKTTGWDEFIEVYNSGNSTVSLKGWKLKDASKKSFTIGSIVIQPQQYFAFYKTDTNIALNNTGSETVTLFDTSGKEVDVVSYTGEIPKDQSYAKGLVGWAWTTTPSPGKQNEISDNKPPVAVIDFDDEAPVGMEVTFDGSRSKDPEGTIISIEWKIEDKVKKGLLVKHTFKKVGVYPVSVVLTDAAGGKTEEALVVTIKGAESFVGGPVLDELSDVTGIRIEEIYPYPGTGEEEFIELFHAGLFPVNLSLFQLDDATGGSRPYKFPAETIIEPGQYMVFPGSATGLTLNNSADSVRLLSPVGVALQEVPFSSAVKQASYSNIKGNWQWTSVPTPGKPNIEQPLASKPVAASVTTKKVTSVSAVKKTSTGKTIKPTYKTSLAGLRSRTIGDKIETEGVVSVLPGVYGAQYFYVVDGNNQAVDAGVQVYMYSKEFPEMKIGDRVALAGELMKTNGELRVKLDTRSDIQVVSSGVVPSPKMMDIADIAEQYEGWLVSVTGEVTEAKSTHVYVDDGSEEIKAYFKQGANINPKQFRVGDTVEVTGIVNRTKTGYQLLPRSASDIAKIAEAETPDMFVVAGGVGSSVATAKMYLTTTAAGLTSVLLGLAARARGAMMLVFLKRIGGVAIGFIRKFRG